MMVKKGLISIIIVVLILAFSIPTFAQDNDTISQNMLKEISNILISEGVPKAQQKVLINKLIAGELWDCVNPDKQNLIPEDYFTFSVYETGEKKFVFPDGSFKKVAVEVNSNGQYTPRIISNVTRTFTGTNIFSTIRVTADLTLTDFNESRFVNIHKPLDISGIGGSISDVDDQYVRQIQEGSLPAHYQVFYRFSGAIPPFISTMMRFDCFVNNFSLTCDLVDL